MSDLPVSPGPGDIRLQRRLILDLLPLRRLRWSGNFDINHFDHFRHFHSCLTMCGIPFLGQACRVLSGACNPMLCPMCVFRTLRREQPVLAPGRARMPAVLRAVHWEQWPDMRAAYRLSTHTQPPTQPPSHPATQPPTQTDRRRPHHAAMKAAVMIAIMDRSQKERIKNLPSLVLHYV